MGVAGLRLKDLSFSAYGFQVWRHQHIGEKLFFLNMLGKIFLPQYVSDDKTPFRQLSFLLQLLWPMCSWAWELRGCGVIGSKALRRT